jgi:hypothetical protein
MTHYQETTPIATPDQLKEQLQQKDSMAAQAIRLLELLDRREASARSHGDTQLIQQLGQERRYLLSRL